MSLWVYSVVVVSVLLSLILGQNTKIILGWNMGPMSFSYYVTFRVQMSKCLGCCIIGFESNGNVHYAASYAGMMLGDAFSFQSICTSACHWE